MHKVNNIRGKKIYGVRGLMEWHAVLMVGGHTVEVDFTGGTLTGYGVTPARYATDDPVMQKLIEKSRHFQEGKIFIISARG